MTDWQRVACRQTEGCHGTVFWVEFNRKTEVLRIVCRSCGVTMVEIADYANGP